MSLTCMPVNGHVILSAFSFRVLLFEVFIAVAEALAQAKVAARTSCQVPPGPSAVLNCCVQSVYFALSRSCWTACARGPRCAKLSACVRSFLLVASALLKGGAESCMWRPVCVLQPLRVSRCN